MPSEPENWLMQNMSSLRVADCTWTMVRYDFPESVRMYIKTNWVKLNDENEGTYAEPEYYKTHKEELDTRHQPLIIHL